MRQLTLKDLEDLSLGSAVLGSGGGGDSTYASTHGQTVHAAIRPS